MKRVVLAIAGSDSGGGAGVQGDLKTFEYFGLFGASAITVLTSQNTTGVFDIYPVSKNFLSSQIRAVFDDFDVSAIKIGMLYSVELIRTVEIAIKNLNIPVILDPVCVSKAGSQLLQDDALEALKKLANYATVVTPNLREAKLLYGYDYADTDSLAGIINSGNNILIKNHFLEKDNKKLSIDILYNSRNKKIFETPFLDTSNLHGAGCAYSSAIASLMGLGMGLEEAIFEAKIYIYKAILNAPNIGRGNGPINHKIEG